MSEKIKALQKGEGGNYIFPFFWQHGETETVLREYMKVIHEANIGAVCVESRPHPDFCGEQWWHDMDIILEEAKRYGMKVWILDDSHFPTGYANGAMKDQPLELYRQSITCRQYRGRQGEQIVIPAEDIKKARPFEPNMMEQMMTHNSADGATKQFEDDRLLGIYAIRQDGAGGFLRKEYRINLISEVSENGLLWEVPEGEWKVYVLQLTRNRGPHRDYINMMDRESCKVQIQAVYEPHWEHYQAEFGTTIAGFFSDEPELGNGHLYDHNNGLGCSEEMDYPWSRELEAELKEELGEDFVGRLALLWEQNADKAVYWEFPGFQGKIGFISAISHKFCKDCNRIRMTAEGFVKPCLQFAQGVDMRSLLRGQTDDEELKQVFEQLIYEKPRCHQFETEKADESLEQREMSKIGG